MQFSDIKKTPMHYELSLSQKCTLIVSIGLMSFLQLHTRVDGKLLELLRSVYIYTNAEEYLSIKYLTVANEVELKYILVILSYHFVKSKVD